MHGVPVNSLGSPTKRTFIVNFVFIPTMLHTDKRYCLRKLKGWSQIQRKILNTKQKSGRNFFTTRDREFSELRNRSTKMVYSEDLKSWLVWISKDQKEVGLEMVGISNGIWKPNHLISGQMTAILSITIWKPDKNVCFWMVGTWAIAIAKPDQLKSNLRKDWISNVSRFQIPLYLQWRESMSQPFPPLSSRFTLERCKRLTKSNTVGIWIPD